MKENELSQIMDINVGNIKEKQAEFLTAHIVKTLEDITSLAKNREWQKIIEKLEFSGAGDGWGRENHFINFCYKAEKDGGRDLVQVILELAKITEQDINLRF